MRLPSYPRCLRRAGPAGVAAWVLVSASAWGVTAQIETLVIKPSAPPSSEKNPPTLGSQLEETLGADAKNLLGDLKKHFGHLGSKFVLLASAEKELGSLQTAELEVGLVALKLAASVVREEKARVEVTYAWSTYDQRKKTMVRKSCTLPVTFTPRKPLLLSLELQDAEGKTHTLILALRAKKIA